MKENKHIKLFLKYYMLILFYLFLTVIIYGLSKKNGMEGVTLKIFGGGDDGFFYWDQAQKYVKGESISDVSIYPLVIGIITKFFGVTDVLVIRLFNFTGFLLLLFSSRALLLKVVNLGQSGLDFNVGYKIESFFIVFFFSYLSILMNVNLSIYRDVWIYTFYIISLNFSVEIMLKKNKSVIPLLFISLLILSSLRMYAVVAFILSAFIFFLIYKKKNMNRIFLISIIVFGIYYTFFLNYSVPLLNMSLSEALNYRNQTIEMFNGGSNMHLNFLGLDYFTFLLRLMKSIIANTIGPFLWQVNSLTLLLVFLLESLPMIYVLIFIYKKREKISLVEKYLVINFTIWSILIGIINDNLGTATRLRVIAWIPMFIVFLSLKYKDRELRKEK